MSIHINSDNGRKANIENRKTGKKVAEIPNAIFFCVGASAAQSMWLDLINLYMEHKQLYFDARIHGQLLDLIDNTATARCQSPVLPVFLTGQILGNSVPIYPKKSTPDQVGSGKK